MDRISEFNIGESSFIEWLPSIESEDRAIGLKSVTSDKICSVVIPIRSINTVINFKRTILTQFILRKGTQKATQE